MTIIELIQADSFFTKSVGSTGGGEYAGPCPWCGGDDRFRCWPNQGEFGKFWCRQCSRSGDAIQYLKDYRRMTYLEACEYLGREPRLPPLAGGLSAPKPAWAPRGTTAPPEFWQDKASLLVNEAIYHLFAPVGNAALNFLIKKKGLTPETIRKFCLGWIPSDRWDAAPAWGLREILKDNGKPKKVWLPKGVSIPLLQGGQVVRVRIRRPYGDPRYFILRGSSTMAMLMGDGKLVAVVVESELDAMLLYQEVGKLVNLVCIGNAQTRPDAGTADLLKQSRLILVALDADQAGATESWRWWMNQYPQARRWPPIQGKDPGEMFAAGVNIKAWIEAGLAEYGEIG
jgi:DNA primase